MNVAETSDGWLFARSIAPGFLPKPSTPPADVPVQLLAMNDFHGSIVGMKSPTTWPCVA